MTHQVDKSSESAAQSVAATSPACSERDAMLLLLFGEWLGDQKLIVGERDLDTRSYADLAEQFLTRDRQHPAGCTCIFCVDEPKFTPVANQFTDEPRTEVEYGINCGDPAECCDPWFITTDPGTAHETAQVIREPHVMTRTATITYGPWELAPAAADEVAV